MIRRTVLAVLASATIGLVEAAAQSHGERDTDFSFAFWQRTEDPPGLESFITTTATYPCVGYSLRATALWSEDTLTISILGMVRPSPCFFSMTEATGNLYLGNIVDGKYLLRIRYRDDEDLYRLRIAKAGLSFFPLQQGFSEVYESEPNEE